MDNIQQMSRFAIGSSGIHVFSLDKGEIFGSCFAKQDFHARPDVVIAHRPKYND